MPQIQRAVGIIELAGYAQLAFTTAREFKCGIACWICIDSEKREGILGIELEAGDIQGLCWLAVGSGRLEHKSVPQVDALVLPVEQPIAIDLQKPHVERTPILKAATVMLGGYGEDLLSSSLE